MIEILIVLLVLGAAAVVFYPALSGASAASRHTSGAAGNPGVQEEIERLTERKERVLRSLRELDSELAAGRLDERAYQDLKRRDEVEAAKVLRELDAVEASLRSAKTGKRAMGKKAAAAVGAEPKKGLGGRLAWVGGIAVFAVLLAITMSKAIAPRSAGGSITGTIPGENPGTGGGASTLMPRANPIRLAVLEGQIARDSNNVKNLLEAGHLYLAEQRLDEAARVTIKTLELQRGSAEAHAHIAVLLMAEAGTHESADSAEMASSSALLAINQAIKLDPNLPEAWLFKGMVMMAGMRDAKGAAEAWEHYLRIAPPDADTTRIAAMVRNFKSSQ